MGCTIAGLWLNSDFGATDYISGALIVADCLATSLKKDDFNSFLKALGISDEIEGSITSNSSFNR